MEEAAGEEETPENRTEGRWMGCSLGAGGERDREWEDGEGRTAPSPALRLSGVGERQVAAPLGGNAPGGAGAQGRGGDEESSLEEHAARLATRAQDADGPAIEHAALRWP